MLTLPSLPLIIFFCLVSRRLRHGRQLLVRIRQMSRDPNQQTPTSYSNSSPESRTIENNCTTPTSPYSDRSKIEMATLPPPSHLQQQDSYAAHSNYAVYPPHAHAQMPYLHTAQAAASSSQPQSFPTQPAPRQRTAIACRYCRRRKVRYSTRNRLSNC